MSYQAHSMRIVDLIRGVESNKYYLPAIQREFVWPSDRIEQLFESLMRGYPIGTLLLWEVRNPAIHEFQFYELMRNFDVRRPHNIKADLTKRDECLGILDGQQRVTALYLGLRGTYTEKLPRLRWDSPWAFPTKRLHINLLYEPPTDEVEIRFQLRFLSDDQAKSTDQAFWFPVEQILDLPTMDALRTYRRASPHRDSATFQDTLEQLWVTIHSAANITYFLETGQDLDQVLEIFVRLNRGGMPLSYSDLLLSLATATWKTHDAREEVYRLMEQLNNDCGNFSFSKDFVLKTSLVFSGGDVRFQAKNIRKRDGLENIWEHVATSLGVAARLLNDFGLDRQTLTATNAAIPIAYYLYRRNLNEEYLTLPSFAQDRERIRTWILRSLLGRMFGGHSDQLLTDLRRVLQTIDLNEGFPVEALDSYLRRRGSFSLEQIDTFIEESVLGDSNVFQILALLIPHLNRQQGSFHIYTLHTWAHNKERLQATGIPEEDIQWIWEHWNHVPNLCILPDAMVGNQAHVPLADWLKQHVYSDEVRQMAFIPHVDLDISNFRIFYETRKQWLSTELKKRLGLSAANSLPAIIEEEI